MKVSHLLFWYPLKICFLTFWLPHVLLIDRRPLRVRWEETKSIWQDRC